jgi:hypothetical protein
MRTAAFPIALLGLVALACGNPIHDDAVDSLGSEAPGVPAGPYHRPGQPCAVCHSPEGPANSVFTLAGTVYQYPDSPEPLQNAIVRAVDSSGRHAFTGTNCVGNFWFQEADFDPVWPVWVAVYYGDPNGNVMHSPIYRNRSCAKCHAAVPDESHTYQVFYGQAPLVSADGQTRTPAPLDPCR